ncbi:hypothetical protein B4U80_11901 [Leptotrombidium deliense]|uniref:F-box domain-containing protein n=1 Tax=Leptotrombidium deliense TaxID=299467 RepID=A0A443S158_9ACAR|nr:hypothetical protein B4U80_11901 [Leptotrombidium deliense]
MKRSISNKPKLTDSKSYQNYGKTHRNDYGRNKLYSHNKYNTIKQQKSHTDAKVTGALFERLPIEMKTAIFEHLSINDLMNARLVSKKWKSTADSVLQFKKSELVFNGNVCFKQIQAMMNMYSKSPKVVIKNLKMKRKSRKDVNFEEFINECLQQLPKLQTFEVNDCLKNRNQILSITVLLTLKDLTLKNVNISDSDASVLFQELLNLTTIDLDVVPINGDCFANIGLKMRSIRWWNKDAILNPKLTFSSNAVNLLEFSYTNERLFTEDSQILLETISHEMHSLQKLELWTTDAIDDISRLRLHSLESLEITAFEIRGIDMTVKLSCVQHLLFSISDIHEKSLISFLLKFPNLTSLVLDFTFFNSKASSIPMTNAMLEYILALNLKSFGFIDMLYNSNQYVDSRENNILIALLRKLEHTQKIKVHLKSKYGTDDMLQLTKDEIEDWAVRRKSLQSLSLKIE